MATTEHVDFGRTGLRIPPIVFGTTSLGNLFRAHSEQTKHEIIRQWFEHVADPVITDSAGKYGAGLALEVMGRELAAQGIDPGRIIISNKLGWRRVSLETPEPTFEPGAWVDLEHDAVQDISYDGILRCWEQGCELLGPYRPALVSVHDPDEYLAASKSESDRQDRWRDILDAYRALEELKRDGVVSGVGVGSKDWTVIRDLADEVSLDWVMFANSLTIMKHPPELLALINALARREVGIINAAVFHSGFLVGGDYFDYRMVSKAREDDGRLLEWRRQFQDVCRELGVSPAHACVRFGASPPGVSALALDNRNPGQVAENVASVGTELPAPFWRKLKELNLIERDYPYVG